MKIKLNTLTSFIRRPMITQLHVRIGNGVHLRTYLWGIRIWTGPRLWNMYDNF